MAIKHVADMPGYDATTLYYQTLDGAWVTYEMCYTDGRCVSTVTGEVQGWHCWHLGASGVGPAFCCRCSRTRRALPGEPSH